MLCKLPTCTAQQILRVAHPREFYPTTPCLLAHLPRQVILALCHEGEHPIHTKDREAMVEALEAQVWRGRTVMLLCSRVMPCRAW